MAISLHWRGTISPENRDFGLLPAFEDVVFVSSTLEQETPYFLKTVVIDPKKAPTYTKPYAVDWPSRLFFYEESDSTIFSYEIDSGSSSEFATIFPSHYCGREFAVSKSGGLIAANEFSFYIFDESGKTAHFCSPVACSMGGFEPPAPLDFEWEALSGFPTSVGCNRESFVLGGIWYKNIYQYELSGAFKRAILLPGENDNLLSVRIKHDGHVFATTWNGLYVFHPTDDTYHYWHLDEFTKQGISVSFDAWFGIGRDGMLWMHGNSNTGNPTFYAVEVTW